AARHGIGMWDRDDHEGASQVRDCHVHDRLPGRGGDFGYGASGGGFAVAAAITPSNSNDAIGFRCDARSSRHQTSQKERVMRHVLKGIALAALVLLASAAGPSSGPLRKCPADAVVSGAECMDKYEASVWRVPNPTTTNRALVARIQQGRAAAVDLAAGG